MGKVNKIQGEQTIKKRKMQKVKSMVIEMTVANVSYRLVSTLDIIEKRDQ